MTDPGPTPDRTAWIALASTPGVGPVTFERLVAAFGGPREALEAVSRWSLGDLDARLARRLSTRLRPGLATAIRAAAADPGRVARRMAALGGWLLTPLDASYPEALHQIEEPPRLLYGLGLPSALSDGPIVAVVGTRRPTALGRDLATRVATRLVEAGATVVSGLAVGVDGAAHRAALDTGGRTVAVIGSGPDEPGPSPHRRLARAIAASGAIVSELAPGVQATQGTYPRRNRIISGLASAAIVIEAPARSGALITARHALEQGRQLLVAPGRPMDPAVAGNLALLRGSPARPLVGLDEMLVDLGLDGSAERPSVGGRLSAAAALGLLDGPQRDVAAALCRGPRSVDALMRECGHPAGVVAAALTILQLRGWARVLGALHLPAGPLIRDPSARAA
jgi:DNA processing protein